MKAIQKIVPLIIALFLMVNIAFGQTKKNLVNVDSLKAEAKKAIRIDTAKLNQQLAIDKRVKKTIDDKLKQAPIARLLKKDSTRTRKLISLSDFSIEDAVQYAPVKGVNPTPDYINRIEVNGQLAVYGIPLNLDLVNNYNPLNDLKLDHQNLFKFDLAKDQLKQQFQQLYQADLQKYKDLKNKKFAGMNVQQHLKKGIQDRIQSHLPAQLSNNPKLMSYLNNPAAINELLKMDEAQMKAKMTSVLTDLKTEMKTKGEDFYRSKKDSLTGKLTALKDSITHDVQTQVNEITSYVQSVKQELNTYGLDEQKLELLEKMAAGKVSEKELETFFISQLSQQPKLQGAQKIYAKFQEFKAGNFGSMLPGSFMNKDLFLNGVSLTLKTLRGPVKAGVAVQKDIGLPKDLEFNRSAFSSPKLLTYLSIPTTNFSFGSGKLSWVGQYDKQYQQTNLRQSAAIPKTNLVFTATQNVNFNKLGKLTIDISKSSVQYSNLVNGPDEFMISNTTQGNYFRDDFLQTMSVGVNHAFESKKTGMNSNVYFTYAGIGFQNPGQQGIGNMNMRFGGNLKKNFFKNKMTFYVRSDVKNTPISAESHAHWQNYNVQLDSKIRLSKTSNFSLKYIANGISKVTTGNEAVYAGKKLQADFNARYKLFGKHSFSFISVGRQDMDNLALLSATPAAQPQQGPAQTNFMLTNYMHSVVFADFTLNGNLFYNKQLTKNALLGDMLNADVACQFMLFKSIGVSSGFTYLNNENIAKQVGIRQNIQFMLKKHFDVSAFLDLRKNLITPLYPDLFAKGRAEVSLRYYLDKQ